jgi:hypothetical protein
VSAQAAMTAEERRAIEWECAHLVARYANLNDAGDWPAVVALFAPDGRLARPTTPDDFIEGRAAILAGFEARPPRVTRHVCSNVVIDVESDTTARGESAMVLWTAADKAPIVGSFHDRFVLTDEGWRFAERLGSLTFS